MSKKEKVSGYNYYNRKKWGDNNLQQGKCYHCNNHLASKTMCKYYLKYNKIYNLKHYRHLVDLNKLIIECLA